MIVAHMNMDAKEAENASRGTDEEYYDDSYEEWEEQVTKEDEGEVVG